MKGALQRSPGSASDDTVFGRQTSRWFGELPALVGPALDHVPGHFALDDGVFEDDARQPGLGRRPRVLGTAATGQAHLVDAVGAEAERPEQAHNLAVRLAVLHVHHVAVDATSVSVQTCARRM